MLRKMVSSRLSGLTKSQMCKPMQTPLLFSSNHTDDIASDNVELDFSDVFGPIPLQLSIEVNYDDLANSSPSEDAIVYDDPVVIHNRSHSLVGPSSYVSQSLTLSKLTIKETEDSEVLVECIDRYATRKSQEPSVEMVADDKSHEDVDGDCVEIRAVGIEDFEVLKVVGGGAFAKVYQVRKKGTSDIYAMKVMRKDKIMEKDHAEYMKAERNILTKIDHPFIVQLRYSFQVTFTWLYTS